MSPLPDYHQTAFNAVISRNRQSCPCGVSISLADAEPLLVDPFVMRRYDCFVSVLDSSSSEEEVAPKRSRRNNNESMTMTCSCGTSLDLSKHKEATVIEMLRFVYLGETHDLTAKICFNVELVLLAKELEFTELLNYCSTWLESSKIELTDATVDRLFGLAVSVGCVKLTKRCIVKYLTVKGKLAEVVETLLSDDTKERMVDHIRPVFRYVFGFAPFNFGAVGNQPQSIVTGFATFNDVQIEKIMDGERVLFPDVDVKVCYDGAVVTYHCHRNILSNSPVLKAIMEGEMTEKREGVITITDVPYTAVVAVLKYVYSGKLTEVASLLKHPNLNPPVFLAELVIRKAHEYELPELMDHCMATLMKVRLTTGNVLRILGIARLYSLPELQNRCLQFFYEHRATVTEHQSFEEFVKNDVDSVRLCVEAAMNHFFSNRTFDLDYRLSIDDFDNIDFEVSDKVTVYTEEIMGIEWGVGVRKHRNVFKPFLTADLSMCCDWRPTISAKLTLDGSAKKPFLAADGSRVSRSLNLQLVQSNEMNVRRYEADPYVRWPSIDADMVFEIALEF